MSVTTTSSPHSFQSTPPRGGRPPSSTAWSGRSMRLVSIHAPARGATPARAVALLVAFEFQSTPPRGGRPTPGGPDHRAKEVSIHAPARGATRLHAASRSTRESVSIHAPARGATTIESSSGPCTRDSFNPRPRAGGDPDFRDGRHAMMRTMQVSIHAPARGATRRWGASMHVVKGFNPRPRAGGDWPVAAP